MKVEEQKVVARVAQDLIASLPLGGKLDVLNYLLGQLNANNPEGLSAESRDRLLHILSGVGMTETATTGQAAVGIAPHKLCRLKVTESRLGRDVIFVIPQGMSGRQILEAIEKANPRGKGDRVVCPKSDLLNDEGLATIATIDRHVSVRICHVTANLTRSEQRAKLAEDFLDIAPRWTVTLAAALYRDANGFPRTISDIGTSKDRGDLFKGLWVRAASGVLTSAQSGLNDDNWDFDSLRSGRFVAAGSLTSIRDI